MNAAEKAMRRDCVAAHYLQLHQMHDYTVCTVTESVSTVHVQAKFRRRFHVFVDARQCQGNATPVIRILVEIDLSRFGFDCQCIGHNYLYNLAIHIQLSLYVSALSVVQKRWCTIGYCIEQVCVSGAFLFVCSKSDYRR